MATVQIKGFVHVSADADMHGNPHYTFFTFDATGSAMGYVLVGPAEFTYEVPDTFSPTAAAVAALQAERDKAARDFADTVRRIDERISKLQALTNEVTA